MPKKYVDEIDGIPIKRSRDEGVVPQKATHKHPKITPDVIYSHTWYCLRSAPQKEFLVQDILKLCGFLTYVPVRKEWKFKNGVAKTKRQKDLVSYPQMNGYVFIGFQPQQLYKGHTPYWRTLMDQHLILGAVGIDGVPLPINRNSLLDLSQAHPNGMQRPKHEKYQRTHGEFSAGDTVRVCEGPFDGLHVPVVSIDKDHAIISIELFGGEKQIRIDTFSLEKVA